VAIAEVAKGGVGMGGNVLKGAVGSALAVGAAMNTFFRVREGEVALKEDKLGRVRRQMFIGRDGEEFWLPKLYMTGVHVIFPGLEHYKKTSTQDQTNPLPDKFATLGNQKFMAESSFTWRVSTRQDHVWRALYKIDTVKEDLQRKVVSIGSQAIWSALMETDPRAILSSNIRDEIYEAVEEKSREPLIEYGVEMRGLEIETSETDASLIAGAIRESGAGNIATLGALGVLNGNGEHAVAGNGSTPGLLIAGQDF
jgi:regulator of protease activity HflC (stomatin/prohibitin superfamily)